jgi:hypothetical protein
MHTYQASVRAQIKGRSQVIKTEVRALNAQDARWLLWAQWGFHSIQAGPRQVNTKGITYRSDTLYESGNVTIALKVTDSG